MEKLTLWKEIRRQLTNTPSFFLNIPGLEGSQPIHLEYLDQQIEEALRTNQPRLIFLLGPFGSGKTTQIHYFIRKHPKINYTHKSYVKINTLDLAFLHLTSYMSRCLFLILFCFFSLLIIWMIPATAALPFLLIIGYFFVKNVGNLVYILHEASDNLTTGKHRLVIIEDLERSSLSSPDQWALLANLWQLKRTYLISLGYSTDDKGAKLKTIEWAQKLGGAIVEIVPYKQLNYSLIKKLDSDFPFEAAKGEWISLFTPREMMMIQGQANLRASSKESSESKKQQYIHICLDLLLAKLGLVGHGITYGGKKLKGLSTKNLSPEQAYFLSSFSESISDSSLLKPG